MKSVLAALFAVAVAATAVAAQGRDFAGTWNFDAAKTGPTTEAKDGAAPKAGSEPAGSRRAGPGGPAKVVITQAAKTISITMGGNEATALTFNLDGTESNLAHDGKGKVAWKGDKLEVTITNARGPQSVMFYRQGAWLVVEPPAGQGEKMFFSKAAGK